MNINGTWKNDQEIHRKAGKIKKQKTENKKKTTTTKKSDLSSDILVITLNANGPNKSIKR